MQSRRGGEISRTNFVCCNLKRYLSDKSGLVPLCKDDKSRVGSILIWLT